MSVSQSIIRALGLGVLGPDSELAKLVLPDRDWYDFKGCRQRGPLGISKAKRAARKRRNRARRGGR